MVRHDQFMKPIVPNKYDIGIIVHNCPYPILYELEPWCSTIYVATDVQRDKYIEMVQKETLLDLKERVKVHADEITNNVVIELDASKLDNHGINFFEQLPDIIKDSGEIGLMEYDIFKVEIKALERYEQDLVVCES